MIGLHRDERDHDHWVRWITPPVKGQHFSATVRAEREEARNITSDFIGIIEFKCFVGAPQLNPAWINVELTLSTIGAAKERHVLNWKLSTCASDQAR
jgi:hypothetical protein